MGIVLDEGERKRGMMIRCSEKKGDRFCLGVGMEYIVYFLLIEEVGVMG